MRTTTRRRALLSALIGLIVPGLTAVPPYSIGARPIGTVWPTVVEDTAARRVGLFTETGRQNGPDPYCLIETRSFKVLKKPADDFG